MTEIRIATDYLTGLFAMLASGHINPAQVDWPFAAECWMAVCGEIKRLHQRIRIAAESTDSFMRSNEQLRAERDKFWADAMELESVKCELHGCKLECDQAKAERDELIEMLKELLRENYISNSRRTAAYDLVVRLGGYRGNADE